MLLTEPIAHAIADGSVTVVFRRWARPRVKAGGMFRTGVGVIRVTSVDEVAEITDTDAAAAGAASAHDVLADLRGDPATRSTASASSGRAPTTASTSRPTRT